MISHAQKHTHFAAATSLPTDQSCKKSMLFANPKKNFKIFSPTLQKKLKHPIHNPRHTNTLTGYDFIQMDTVTGHGRRRASANSTYPKGGVSCSKDSFVVNQTLVFQIKFCGKSPALRVAAKRCQQLKPTKPYKEKRQNEV